MVTPPDLAINPSMRSGISWRKAPDACTLSRSQASGVNVRDRDRQCRLGRHRVTKPWAAPRARAGVQTHVPPDIWACTGSFRTPPDAVYHHRTGRGLTRAVRTSLGAGDHARTTRIGWWLPWSQTPTFGGARGPPKRLTGHVARWGSVTAIASRACEPRVFASPAAHRDGSHPGTQRARLPRRPAAKRGARAKYRKLCC